MPGPPRAPRAVRAAPITLGPVLSPARSAVPAVVDRRWRRRAAAVSTVLVAAVLSPLWRSPERDSFPLSTYPMFARPLVGEADLDVAVGLDAGGGRRALSPEAIAGTDEVVQAGAVVDRAIAAGREDELCRQVAQRVTDPAVVAVVVLTDRIEVLGAAEGEPPVATTVHARCEVP